MCWEKSLTPGGVTLREKTNHLGRGKNENNSQMEGKEKRSLQTCLMGVEWGDRSEGL